MKKILILGASGFIGRQLLNYFDKENYKLLVVSRKNIFNKNCNITLLKTDLKNINKDEFLIIKDFDPKICIYLAYEGIPDYSLKNSKFNYFLAVKFFNKIKKLNLDKIICTGTCWEYDNIIGKKNEKNSKLNSLNYFPHYKIKLYRYLLENFKSTNIIWCRLFFVYGFNRNNKLTLTNTLINAFKKKRLLKINNLNTKCDFIYVKNVAYIIFKIVNNINHNKIINIGSGKLLSIKSFILKFEKYFKYKFQIENQNISSNFDKIFADNCFQKKIAKKLPYSFDSSIKDILINQNDR